MSARLEELGVEPGDIVHVADYELIWDQASLMAEEREAARRKRRTKRERLAKRSGFKHEFDEGNSPEAG
jgi:GTP-binding protein